MNKTKRGRPRKNKGDRKDVDLRIPVTTAQKNLVMEAVEMDGADMASWVRPIILQAAENRLARQR